MKRLNNLFIYVLTTIILCFWVASCSKTTPSQFYTINPLSSIETNKKTAPFANKIGIGINSVEIPDYLNRPQLVFRKNKNEVSISEFNRWAGSLKDNINNVMTENLAVLLNTDRVYVPPRIKIDEIDFLISINIYVIEFIPGDQVILKGSWIIMQTDMKKEVSTRIFSLSEKINTGDLNEMIDALSLNFDNLSKAIAGEIKSLKKS
jgi:uncharacterized lipoprotein YmbA